MSDLKEGQDTPVMMPIGGCPQTAEEMVNKYGTYEIQPTADNDALFPAIAQGLPKAFSKPINKPRIKRIREEHNTNKSDVL